MWNDTQAKLDYLNTLDKFRSVFGASSHQYRLRPKLTSTADSDSLAFIPSQLQTFYTQLGNGGAGPNYGVLPVDKLHRYRPEKPYQGVAHYRDIAKANDSFWDDDDAYKDGYFELNHDRFDGLIGFSEEGCGHVACIVSAGPQLGEVVHLSCDGFLHETGVDFSTFYARWLDYAVSLFEQVRAWCEADLRPIEEIVASIRSEYKRVDGYQLVMGVINADVLQPYLKDLTQRSAWCQEQLDAYREQRRQQFENPQQVLVEPIKRVPQFLEHPVEFEYLSYKASWGSYKAADILQLLLRFTATAVIGGDPWDELSAEALEDSVRYAFQRYYRPSADAPDPIAMAMRWAWAPMEGSWITYDKDELLLAIDALLFVLRALPKEQLTQRMIVGYQLDDDVIESDWFELGRTLRLLDVTHDHLNAVARWHPVATSDSLLRGWQYVDKEDSADRDAAAEQVPAPLQQEPEPPPQKNYIGNAVRGTVSGAVAGIVGGGLFGVLVMIGEQYDSKYDDPSLLSMLMGAPLFAILGAIVGLPLGLVSGLLIGLFVAPRISPQQAPRFGLIGGAMIGAGIGASLQGVSIRGDLVQTLLELLLVVLALLSGAAGGYIGGRFYHTISTKR